MASKKELENDSITVENADNEWGWDATADESPLATADDPVNKDVAVEYEGQKGHAAPSPKVSSNKLAINSDSKQGMGVLSMKKGITSSPSFQELEKAIGATLAMSFKGSFDGDPLSPGPSPGPSPKGSTTLQQQRNQQQSKSRRQQLSQQYNLMNTSVPTTASNARAELANFINETESRAVIVFHPSTISPVTIRDACQKFGVLYYIRPEFHGKGVTLISYFDLRCAVHAHESLKQELDSEEVSAHYSVMLHSANNNSEEFRLVVRRLPACDDESHVHSLFSRYGQLKSIQRINEESDDAVSTVSTDQSKAVAPDFEEKSGSLLSYIIEYYNIQDARLAASELSATSAQLWGPETLQVIFSPLDARKQQLCRQLLATLSKWRSELAASPFAQVGGHMTTAYHMQMMGSQQAAYPSNRFVTGLVPAGAGMDYVNTNNMSTFLVHPHSPVHGSLQAPPLPPMHMQQMSVPLPIATAGVQMMTYGIPQGISSQAATTSLVYGAVVSPAVSSDDSYTSESKSPMRLYASASNNHRQDEYSDYSSTHQHITPQSLDMASNSAYSSRAIDDDYTNNMPSSHRSPNRNQYGMPNDAHYQQQRAINGITSGVMVMSHSQKDSSTRPHHHNGGHNYGGGGGHPSASAGGYARKANRSDQSGGFSVDTEFVLDMGRLEDGKDTRTTVMVRNIPNKYNQAMLLEEVNVKYEGTYDFFYLPIDFKNRCNVGYCFVNFMDPAIIPQFVKDFNGQKWRNFNSEKVCVISFARIQGKAAMISRFQNSSLLEKSDELRPLLFYSSGPEKGQPEPFPAPDGNRNNRTGN